MHRHARVPRPTPVAALLAAVFLLAAPASAQVVRGVVTDAESGDAIEDVTVRLKDGQGAVSGTTTTDDDGRFYLESGSLATESVLSLEALGYVTESVLLGDLTGFSDAGVELDVALVPDPLPVEGLVAHVESRPLVRHLANAGFYRRQHANFGSFRILTDEDRTQARVPSDLLRGIQGIRLDQLDMLTGGAGSEPRIRASTIGTFQQDGTCYPSVFLDGSLIRRGAPAARLQRPFDRLVSPNQVQAIEVYRSPSQLPAQYGGNQGGCGVILLWTR